MFVHLQDKQREVSRGLGYYQRALSEYQERWWWEIWSVVNSSTQVTLNHQVNAIYSCDDNEKLICGYMF